LFRRSIIVLTIFSYTYEKRMYSDRERLITTFSVCRDSASGETPTYCIIRDGRWYVESIGDICDSGPEIEEIPAEVAEQVLQVIEKHPELTSCPREISSNRNFDEYEASFCFRCDSFAVRVGGYHILSQGKLESELPAEERSASYIVWDAFRDVEAVLTAHGIEVKKKRA
jgi:hypothetical protein